MGVEGLTIAYFMDVVGVVGLATNIPCMKVKGWQPLDNCMGVVGLATDRYLYGVVGLATNRYLYKGKGVAVRGVGRGCGNHEIPVWG